MEFNDIEFLDQDDNNTSVVIFTDKCFTLKNGRLKQLISKKYSPQGFLSSQNVSEGQVLMVEKNGGSFIYYCVVRSNSVVKTKIEYYQTCSAVVKSHLQSHNITNCYVDDLIPPGIGKTEACKIFCTLMPGVTFTQFPAATTL